MRYSVRRLRALADHLVARGERDQVCEALEGDAVPVMDALFDCRGER